MREREREKYEHIMGEKRDRYGCRRALLVGRGTYRRGPPAALWDQVADAAPLSDEFLLQRQMKKSSQNASKRMS